MGDWDETTSSPKEAGDFLELVGRQPEPGRVPDRGILDAIVPI